MRDWMIEQLPRVLAQDPFLRRFLRILEDVVDPIRDQVAGLEHYVDPAVAPDRYVGWLGRWLDFEARGIREELVAEMKTLSTTLDDRDDLDPELRHAIIEARTADGGAVGNAAPNQQLESLMQRQADAVITRRRHLVMELGGITRNKGTAVALERLLERMTGGAARVDDTGGTHAPLYLDPSDTRRRYPFPDPEGPRPIGVRLQRMGGLSPHRLSGLIAQWLPADAAFEIEIDPDLPSRPPPARVPEENRV